MSDQNPSAPNATAPQKVLIEVAGQQSPQTAADFQRMSPEQFNARLAEAEEAGAKRILKKFGVKKEERAAVLADIEAGRYMLKPTPADGEPDYKTEYEKLKPLATEAEQYKAKLAKHGEYFKKVAEEEFAKLPEPIQKDLTRRNIEDPEARLAEIAAMKESGLLAAIATQGQTANKPATEPKPATTMAPPGPNVNPTAPKTPWEQYDALVKSGNRILAAQFRQQYANAIEASRPK